MKNYTILFLCIFFFIKFSEAQQDSSRIDKLKGRNLLLELELYTGLKRSLPIEYGGKFFNYSDANPVFSAQTGITIRKYIKQNIVGFGFGYNSNTWAVRTPLTIGLIDSSGNIDTSAIIKAQALSNNKYGFLHVSLGRRIRLKNNKWDIYGELGFLTQRLYNSSVEIRDKHISYNKINYKKNDILSGIVYTASLSVGAIRKISSKVDVATMINYSIDINEAKLINDLTRQFHSIQVRASLFYKIYKL